MSAVEMDDLKKYHLSSWRSNESGRVDERAMNKIVNPMAHLLPGMKFCDPDETVAMDIISGGQVERRQLQRGCVRANATHQIWWQPPDVRAAIVTCGGLCPGLNSVIRGVTRCLWFEYGVRNIVGITSGFNGLSNPEVYKPVQLTAENVFEIHMKGGTILRSARGGFEAEKICDNLIRLGINMLFAIGGDGTQFAANLLYEAAQRRNLPVSIIGIPKSIDNDILFIDKTFGFDSAVAAASEVIRNGWTEASGHPRGVGIVKLMGRDSGSIAMHAALASDLVDLCIIPEVTVHLDDVIAYVEKTLSANDHMVIAVAEGAAQEFVNTGTKDATGHTVYGDIGVFLKNFLNNHLKASGGRTFYMDPSYTIRSVPPGPIDHIYCSRLANDAVHTAMRGYTGVNVGAVNNIICILPTKLIASGKRQVDLDSSAWRCCVQICGMPPSLSGLTSREPRSRL